MSDFFSHSQLRKCFGKDRVIDVLDGTNLAAAAAENNYGIILIRGAVSDHVKWAPGIDNMFEKIKQKGVRKTQVKGNRTRISQYSTIQAVSSPCLQV